MDIDTRALNIIKANILPANCPPQLLADIAALGREAHAAGVKAGEAKRPKMFPIQSSKGNPAPTSCHWEVADIAYSDYRKRFGSNQSLERMAQRGGFDANEMDEQYPGWREHEAKLVREDSEAEAKLKQSQDDHAQCEDENVRISGERASAIIRAEKAEAKLAALQEVVECKSNTSMELDVKNAALTAELAAVQKRVKELEIQLIGEIKI